MLDMDIEFRRGVLFVRTKGNLTKNKVSVFKDEVFKVINKSGINNIVINFNNIDNLDDEGIKTIYDIQELVKRNNGNLVICNMSKDIEQKINNDHFNIYKSQNELTALNTFNI